MLQTNTFGIHFTVRERSKKNRELTVYARITVNKSRCEVAIKRTVKKEDWNFSRGSAKPKTTDLKQLNGYLEEIRAKIVNHYRILEREDKVLTALAVKEAYNGNANQQTKEKTLLWLIEGHNAYMNNTLKQGTLKNYRTTVKYLQLFLEKGMKNKNLLLKELKFEFITGFEYFIRNHSIKKNDPCTNNGTMKHLERLKKMVRWAVRNEWLEKNPFEHYQLKYKFKQRDFLSDSELTLLEQKELSNPLLHLVKDLFVFSCYTGLSYIDVMSLETNMITEGKNGTKWIRISRTKSLIGANIPLLKPAINILDKYCPEMKEIVTKKVFPSITNQEVNRSLKILSEICGIDKYLTFHLARHTFATTVTLMNGVPIESISKMLGHTKLSTTMIYAKVSQLKVGMDMEILQEKLNNINSKHENVT